MKTIAVLGANSYIARNVIDILRRNPEEYVLKLYDYNEKHADGLDNYQQVNILSKEEAKRIDFGCDVIFIFTGKTGSANGFTDYGQFLDVNECSLLNLLSEYVSRKSSAKIVFPSTRLVYKGKPGRLTEDAEKEFKTIYSMNKFACEKYLEMYHNVFSLQYCIFRICVPYGALVANASSYGTVEFMLQQAANGRNISLYGAGKMRRTLTYIGDLCETLIAGALSDHCMNDVFNIGGEDYSLDEMAKLIAKRFGVEVNYIPWPEVAEKIESGDTVFDDTKLKNAGVCLTHSNFKNWVETVREK